MSAACLYLAGKIEDNDHLRLRDIINVVTTTLHRDREPLPLDSEYYNTREAIVHAELHVLRMVGFQVRLCTSFVVQYMYVANFLYGQVTF